MALGSVSARERPVDDMRQIRSLSVWGECAGSLHIVTDQSVDVEPHEIHQGASLLKVRNHRLSRTEARKVTQIVSST
jgi:hypothetical protein